LERKEVGRHIGAKDKMTRGFIRCYSEIGAIEQMLIAIELRFLSIYPPPPLAYGIYLWLPEPAVGNRKGAKRAFPGRFTVLYPFLCLSFSDLIVMLASQCVGLGMAACVRYRAL